jgi:hypothetical protein
VTLPELTPEGPDTRRERLVESALMGLIVLLAAVLGGPLLVDSLREGSIELGTVFYPVVLGAIATLAWSRRTGQ